MKSPLVTFLTVLALLSLTHATDISIEIYTNSSCSTRKEVHTLPPNSCQPQSLLSATTWYTMNCNGTTVQTYICVDDACANCALASAEYVSDGTCRTLAGSTSVGAGGVETGGVFYKAMGCSVISMAGRVGMGWGWAVGVGVVVSMALL
ncbi:uncharacterized protein EV422DRAFT_49105 [Fimicolochytrium jonesii]|uniref:uncharacterized protein n=1 Tax=Fimicolochytrium jonesii TaxID=1396493 RepID=UPI0022FE3998|nr:uncharacterized protein EV422DRAFT_49105 [Fimicolochytrium jonesii]KAI8821003.1 hypothetical protein EV422DRAFT_49105 [Fimicolochytrium jonesii]